MVNVTDAQWLLKYIQIPVEASLLALLSVTLVVAIIRFLRRRQDGAALLFVATVVIILLGSVPLYRYGELSLISGVRDWLTNVLATAGVRGLLIGMAMGTIAAGMGSAPIIFAMANPDPEIKYELARTARPDAIVATGRSDYPNQINNVLAFPGIFRGALDVRASDINDEMKIAAVHAIASLVSDAQLKPEYIIANAFDERVGRTVAAAVSRAARDSGVARKK